jgi:hypothetical protein
MIDALKQIRNTLCVSTVITIDVPTTTKLQIPNHNNDKLELEHTEL